MRKKELNQYLKDVCTLESQCYIYQQISQIYEKQLGKLTQEMDTIYYKDGVDYAKHGYGRRNFVLPSPEAKPTYLGERQSADGRRKCIFGFRGVRDMFRDIPERWWDESLRKLEKEEHMRFLRIHACIIAAGIGIGALAAVCLRHIAVCIFPVLVAMLICYLIGDENGKEYLPGNPYYEKFMQVYQERYEKEREEKRALFLPMIAQLKEEYETYVLVYQAQAQEKRKELYAENILKAEYRNFQAAAQLYDYLRTERCTKLSGRDGACQLYKKESAGGKLLNNLEANSFQLEKYSTVMETLVSLLKYKEKVTSDVLAQVRSGQPSSALKAFIQECQQAQDEMKKLYSYSEVG